MSLLIKALDKAEQGKKAEEQTSLSSPELSLEPVSTGAEVSLNQPSNDRSQQAAATTVFSAKQSGVKPGSSKNIFLIAAVAALILLFVGFQLYNYIQGLSKSELILPRSASVAAATLPPPATPLASSVEATPVLAEPVTESPAAQQTTATPAETPEPQAQPVPVNKTKAPQPGPMVFGEAIEGKNTSLQVTKNNPSPQVSPTLMAAYRAFNAGDDSEAQELYRKELRTDVRNVDALLGMAAIAQRQGRNQDAMGWYGKVLEIEPRNAIAQAAIATSVSQADSVSTESRIKSLLALQPNTAHLYAALGSLYMERGQWLAAQQSYFEAHRLEPGNPEYTFNLAISLDQLGKPSLALEYYKKTLDLIQRTSNTTIDRNQLESRISQLQ